VFFGYPGEMSSTCGPDTFLDNLISLAGGRNVVTETGQRWPMVSAEFITGAKPEWIISATSCTGGETIAACQAKIIKQSQSDPVWSMLPAVKAGQILVVDSDLLLRPGPRILDALEQVRHALHPELK
jgi:iron complex transport system substrate-binding protein